MWINCMHKLGVVYRFFKRLSLSHGYYWKGWNWDNFNGITKKENRVLLHVCCLLSWMHRLWPSMAILRVSALGALFTRNWGLRLIKNKEKRLAPKVWGMFCTWMILRRNTSLDFGRHYKSRFCLRVKNFYFVLSDHFLIRKYLVIYK